MVTLIRNAPKRIVVESVVEVGKLHVKDIPMCEQILNKLGYRFSEKVTGNTKLSRTRLITADNKLIRFEEMNDAVASCLLASYAVKRKLKICFMSAAFRQATFEELCSIALGTDYVYVFNANGILPFVELKPEMTRFFKIGEEMK